MAGAALMRGAALVTAMLVAALAAAVVVTLAAGQSQWLRTVELRRDRAQAEAIVLAGLAWTRGVLQEDARGPDVDHAGEPWALPLPRTPLEGGSVEGAIADAQGRLDVNHLAGEDPAARAGRARFARLLARAGLATGLVDAVAAGPGGGADGPPGSAAWLRAAEVSAVAGIGEAGYARIAQFVTALPAAAPLNVNTAPPEVLAAAIDGLDGEPLALLVAERERKPFASLADFRARLPSGASLHSDAALGVRSDHFLVTVRARQGASVAQGRALLRRHGRDLPEVVWQTIE